MRTRFAKWLARRRLASQDIEGAVQWFSRAVGWCPADNEARVCLAEVLIQTGKVDQARFAIKKLDVESISGDSPLLYQFGCVAMDAGLLDVARTAFLSLLGLDPANGKVLNNLGCIASQTGVGSDALSYFEQAVKVAPGLENAWSNLTQMQQASGDAEGRVRTLEAAVAANPKSFTLCMALADALMATGNYQLAIDHFKKALLIRPGNIAAMTGLGNSFIRLGSFEQGKVWFEEISELDDSNLAARIGLLVCCQQLGEWQRLEKEFPPLLEKYPEQGELLSGYGVFLESSGRLQDAVEYYTRAIERSPDVASFHVNRGLAQLALGRYQCGFHDYERRLDLDQLKAFRDLPGQVWQGEPLGDRSLLVVGEQGFGDLIQFSRYLPLLAVRGIQPSYVLAKPVRRLLEGDSRFGIPLDESAAEKWVGLKVPLLSLPGILGTTETSIPADTPYLAPNEEARQKWDARLGPRNGKLRVGLVWQTASNNPITRFKSIPLELLFPLQDLSGIEFVSLHPEVDRTTGLFLKQAGWLDLAGELEDFMETAGAISCLDLVLSVDTAVAHLAGAMGCPVWTMLPYAPDWRWRLAEASCPWYPSMSLFRQPARGDWSSVIGQVSQRLSCVAADSELLDVPGYGLPVS